MWDLKTREKERKTNNSKPECPRMSTPRKTSTGNGVNGSTNQHTWLVVWDELPGSGLRIEASNIFEMTFPFTETTGVKSQRGEREAEETTPEKEKNEKSNA